MNRLALMTGILSLTLVGVAAQAQTQSGSQPKYYQTQPQSQSGTQQMAPGSAYDATQRRSQTQPGQQPKFYQQQNQPSAVSTEPAPASGLGAVGTMTGLTSPPPAPQSSPPSAYQGQPPQSPPPGYAAAPTSYGNLTKDIQSELTLGGYDPGPIDGIAGPRTKKAIRQFQAANGMPQDGAATPQVLDQLQTRRMQASAGAQSTSPQAAAPQPQPAYQTSASASPPPSADSAQKSAGFFSGWFQRMDSESTLNREVQPGYQPKFYRENTASGESQGPGITYPWPEQRPVAQAPAAASQTVSSASPALPGQQAQPSAADAAAMSQIAPAAGAPATGPATPSADASGTRIMTDVEKCQVLGPSAREDCELAAHRKAAEAGDPHRPAPPPPQ